MNRQFFENCGVFGCSVQGYDAPNFALSGIAALQHRGQENAGLAASLNGSVEVVKGVGLVREVLDPERISQMKGNKAIAHTRYGTSWDISGEIVDHSQPVEAKISGRGVLTVSHNGNIPIISPMRSFLESRGINIFRMNDSEMITAVIATHLEDGLEIEEAVRISLTNYVKGAYALIIMFEDKLIAVRDPFGIRPLVKGKKGDGLFFASETCAFDEMGIKYVGDVEAGEMVVVDETGPHSIFLSKFRAQLEIFELFYLMNRNSLYKGKRVGDIRFKFGEILAREVNSDADIVMPVPDTAIDAALGYAFASGKEYVIGLIKNEEIGRTFISPGQLTREELVDLKFSVDVSKVKGKKIDMIDDTDVRGTTAIVNTRKLRTAGAVKVYKRNASPPIAHRNGYGIDLPTYDELLAYNRTLEQMRQHLGVDDLSFLSLKGMIEATGESEDDFDLSCLNGDYPIDLEEKAIPLMKEPEVSTL